jgi:hypothetical protein
MKKYNILQNTQWKSHVGYKIIMVGSHHNLYIYIRKRKP